MNVRGSSFATLSSLMVTDIFQLETLDADEEKIVIEYAYNHIEEFKQVILSLIKDYERFISDENLDAYENKLFEHSRGLEHHLEGFSETLTVSLQALTNTREHIESITHESMIYKQELENLFQIIADIEKIKVTLIADKEKLKQASNRDEFGVRKIERILVFFINLLLGYSSIINMNQERRKNYSEIVISLAEFCYNHGQRLFNVREDANDNETKPAHHIVISLILFLMAQSFEKSLLEKACYIALLRNVLAEKIDDGIWIQDFTLASFAVKSPEKFSKLYDYLFNKHALFSNYLNITYENIGLDLTSGNYDDNIHLTFKAALFGFYMSLASEQLAAQSNDENSKKDHEKNMKLHRERAKNLFLVCLENDFLPVIDIFDQYFVEIDLDVAIKLLLYYFEKKNPKSIITSDIVYSRIVKVPIESHKDINQLLLLFGHWLHAENIYLREIAQDTLASYFKNYHLLANKILYQYADQTIDGAVFYSDLVIAMQDRHRIKPAKKLLNAYECLFWKENVLYRQVLFNLYQLSVMTHKSDYQLLFRAAELNHGQAKNQLFLLHGTSNSPQLHSVLVDALNGNSLLAFQVLNEHCTEMTVEIELAIFALQNKHESCELRINRLIGLVNNKDDVIKDLHPILIKLYEYLLRFSSDNDAKSFAITQLKFSMHKSLRAYHALFDHAKEDYLLTIDLIKFNLKEEFPDSERLGQLRTMLVEYHNDHAPREEIFYYCYLIVKADVHVVNLNLLIEVAKYNNERAIQEFICLYHQFIIEKEKKYEIIIANVFVDFFNAISPFESNLIMHVQSNGVHQYEVAEILSQYYFYHNNFEESEKYIRICLTLKQHSLSCHHSLDETHQHFPFLFKHFYLDKQAIFQRENVTIKASHVSSFIHTKISLFSEGHDMAQRLENEKFELKKMIAQQNIDEDRRFDLLEDVQKIRSFDDVSRVRALVEPFTLRANLSK